MCYCRPEIRTTCCGGPDCHPKPKEPCNSCKNGFDGKNGNGYQPCGCRPATVEDSPSNERVNIFEIDAVRLSVLSVFAVAAIICISV